MGKFFEKSVTRGLFSLLLIGILSCSFLVSAVPASAALPSRDCTIFTSNPEYDKSNYCKSIKFRGNKIIIKGNFEVTDDDTNKTVKMKKASIKIAYDCECEYGDGDISLAKLKKMVKKNNNNCYVSIKIEIDDGEVEEIGLYS